MNPIFFEEASQLREWMDLYHKVETEIFVGIYKVKSKKKTIKLVEFIDTALCYGWIDSRVYSIDSESYCYRFTPRKAKSNWSERNVAKFKFLTEKGLMHPSGLESYNNRKK